MAPEFNHLKTLTTSITTIEGTHTQINSLLITFHPQSLKNLATPIGETVIDRKGKKKRVAQLETENKLLREIMENALKGN